MKVGNWLRQIPGQQPHRCRRALMLCRNLDGRACPATICALCRFDSRALYATYAFMSCCGLLPPDISSAWIYAQMVKRFMHVVYSESTARGEEKEKCEQIK
jgi:hypothetical protein